MPDLWCGDVCFGNVEAVLFDKDGTLADSHAFLKKLAAIRSRLIDQIVPGSGAPLLTAFGCQDDAYDPAGLMAVGTRYENEIAAATYVAATGRAWGESLAIAKDVFAMSDRCFARKAESTPPFIGIPALLRVLYEAGIKIAVLSGDTTANICDFLDCYNLSKLVQWCVGSEQPPVVKPDPLMVDAACQKLDVTPQQCIVVGDSLLDRELARRGNTKAFVSVTWGESAAIEGADVVLSHPEQLHLSPQ